MSSPHLPFEILSNILVRLPLKDLLRFMCVCKTWFSLITHQHFISAHINLHKNSSDGYLLRQKAGPFSNNFSLMHRKTYVELSSFQVPFSCETRYFKLAAASLNGLICLSDSYHYFGKTIYLWNPSISRLKILSHSSFAHHFEDGGTFFALGFAFHHHDFKIVRIMYFGHFYMPMYVEKQPPKVEVYSLAANSWRRIGGMDGGYYANDKSSSAYVNAAVHWFGSKTGNASGDIILSFDFDTEKFGEIILPNYHNGKGTRPQVSVLRESLVLIVLHLNYREQIENCCIWVMREYGVVASWSKEYLIVPQERIIKSLGIINNDNFVMETTNGELVSYDLEKLQFKHLGIGGPGEDITLDLVPFDESLALYNEGFRLTPEVVY